MRPTNEPIMSDRLATHALHLAQVIMENGGEVIGREHLADLAEVSPSTLSRVMWAGAVIVDESMNAALVKLRRADGCHYKITTDLEEIDEAIWPGIRTLSTKATVALAQIHSIEGTDLRTVTTGGNLRTVLAAMRALDSVFAATHPVP